MSRHPRRPELAALVRNAMLDAATTVFARKGYAAATMNEIAAEAGYTAAAFYKYFAGKQKLFEAILERANTEVNAMLAQLPPRDGLGLEATAEALLRAGFELVDRRAEMFAMIAAIRASDADMPTQRVARRQHHEEQDRVRRVAVWLAEAAGSDRIGPVDARGAAAFLATLGEMLYRQWAAEPEKSRGPFADRVPLALQLFLYGVSGAPAARRKDRAAPRRRKG